MKMILVILTAFLFVGCTTHIPVRTEIIIDAPKEIVFAKLVDFASYGSWNPYHIRVQGEPTIGRKLEVRVHRPDGKTIDVPAVHILRMKDNQELTWGGGIKGIFYGEHVFLLENSDGGMTKLVHNEDFKGLFIGFADLPPNVLTEGYHKMNLALKRLLESDNQQTNTN
ncbi:hypothetical protein A9Q83_10035 [Alphaproteobacteria bacterium 46_93_T64]|nr:hypothetical protein A9Q83_10035 [Alphaproteobacteria bacterium 46_93_T64]